MTFLISLIIASVFILTLGTSLRKHSVPYYLGTAVLTLAVIILDLAGVRYIGFLADWIMPIITKGSLAGAIFVIVMWGGALPNGNKVLKLIMPIRGQLSIIASILVFAHAVTFKTYIISLFTKPGSLSGTKLLASICSALLILIMLPLFITSFKNIRKKMNPKRWKNLQRFAYAFYALILAHILFFTFKYAMLGRAGYRLNAVVYTYVFLTYGVCRVMKAIAVKKKKQESLGNNQLKAVAICATAIMVMTVILFGNVKAEVVPAAREAAKASAAGVQNTAIPKEKSEPEVPEEKAETTAEPENENAAETADGTSADPAVSAGPRYNDGDFTGTAFGNSGDITVQISIKDDIITSVVILEQEEDEPYFTDALEVIPAILEANST
ncbi:MAG: ferric reductase-like transmembrane domain-containing protein, partial [Lachnospiraceae bacterium]|nr:ferric reductase-like transmembrane domain-containing protein [Lachnospiraceae bacterium]